MLRRGWQSLTDRSQVFHLEQLTLALTGAEGTGTGVQVLARTPGIRPDHIVECRRVANLPPAPWTQRSNEMPGAFGLFRGETVDYVLAKSQQRPQELPFIHYVLLPALAVRALGGNLRYFEAFARAPIPPEQRSDMPLFVMEHVHPPDADAQSADLVALLDYCQQRVRIISGLLAGLIQGMGVAILHAPPTLRDRLTFVQGLLTLLPAPARVAITFATSVLDPAQTNTQVKFLAQDSVPEQHVIFDWATCDARNAPAEDTYTRFITAQLRLDTSLVIAETEKLARTAVWRAMRRENMASALAWASKRASLDIAVRDGQPAERSMVAAVLREDPTLPDDLRVAYSRHLLSLALALGEPAHTDIIPAIAVQNREVANTVYEQLWAAAGGEQSMAVYAIVEQWIAQAPMGVDVSRWRPLLGMSAMARASRLLTAPPNELAAFLHGFLDAPPALHLENVMAQLIGLCRKRSYDSSDVAREVFLLGAAYLPLGGLQRLLTDQQLVFQLPVALRAALDGLTPQVSELPPAGLLAYGAEAFGSEWQGLVLARLVEWALVSQRPDLIDPIVLRGLVKVAASPLGDRFDTLLQHVVQDLSPLNVLRTLNTESQRHLVVLCLVRQRYVDAVRQLIYYQDMLYQSTRQDALYDIARTAYREAPLETRRLLQALEAAQGDSRLKPVVCVNVDIGALEARQWSVELEPAARHLTALLFNEPRLIASVGIDPAFRLLKANAERRDTVEALRVAGAIVSYTLMFDEHGPDVVEQVYALVSWDAEISAEGLEVVRNYVRRAPIEKAIAVPKLLGRRFGDPVRIALEGTYRMRLIVGGVDFAAFAEQVQVTTSLFMDMALVYGEGKSPPPVIKIRRSVDSMPGGLSEVERQRLVRNLGLIAEQILKLNAQYQARHARRNRADIEARKMAIIKGRAAPGTSIEALSWLGGHLSNGEVIAINLNREAPAYLLGTRSVNTFLRETDLIARLFTGLLAAFPDGLATDIDRHIWTAEARSLWALLSLYQQRSIQPTLAENLQQLAQLIPLIAERSSDRSLQNTGHGWQLYVGRAQPRSALEALRWLAGYFAQEHSRHSPRG
jgi:hypothetical protein